MRIKVYRDKCSGCHLCETICSLFHLGVVNTEKSAVRIEKDDLDTSSSSPVVCRQCRQMKCLEGEKASPETEKEKFIWPAGRSGKCPFHALSALRPHCYHCDLCGGSPQCVKVCTTGAITLYRKEGARPW
jgi:carbon-monoxide dehydrogenase iron sulfur subunit